MGNLSREIGIIKRELSRNTGTEKKITYETENSLDVFNRRLNTVDENISKLFKLNHRKRA